MPIRVTVWHEFRHEKKSKEVAELYPKGMHEAIASHLRTCEDMVVRTATLDDPEVGLPDEVLKNTDVLVWWGHMAHREVPDEVVDRVHKRITQEGMGLLALHSGHFSKIFIKLMGTSCNLKWRWDAKDREVLWVTRPGHPCVQGIGEYFVLPEEEVYGEFFDIPEPECTFLISSFTHGEVFRSGCTWTRGAGKVVYFRPGHETFPTYYDKNVLKVIENSIRYATPAPNYTQPQYGYRKAGWFLEGGNEAQR